jgi:hypothetical protein
MDCARPTLPLPKRPTAAQRRSLARCRREQLSGTSELLVAPASLYGGRGEALSSLSCNDHDRILTTAERRRNERGHLSTFVDHICLQKYLL